MTTRSGPRPVALQVEEWFARRNAQALQRQRQQRVAADHRHQRHPAHHAVFELGIEQAVAAGRLVDLRQAALAGTERLQIRRRTR